MCIPALIEILDAGYAAKAEGMFHVDPGDIGTAYLEIEDHPSGKSSEWIFPASMLVNCVLGVVSSPDGRIQAWMQDDCVMLRNVDPGGPGRTRLIQIHLVFVRRYLDAISPLARMS